MKCPNCEKQWPEGSSSCPNCGAVFIMDSGEDDDWVPSGAPPKPDFPKTEQEQSTAEKPSPAPQSNLPDTSKILMAVGGVVVLLLLLVVLLRGPNININNTSNGGSANQNVQGAGPAPVQTEPQSLVPPGQSFVPSPAPPNPPVVPGESVPPKSPAQNTLGIQFGFFRGDGREIAENDTLTSGDQFRVEFKAEQSCYVYIFNKDSSGAITPLYPRPDQGTGYGVPANTWMRLPGGENMYEVNDRVGKESIILCASLTKLDDMEAFLQHYLANKNSSSNATATTLPQARGVDIKPQKAPIKVGPYNFSLLKGPDTWTYTVEFAHQ